MMMAVVLLRMVVMEGMGMGMQAVVTVTMVMVMMEDVPRRDLQGQDSHPLEFWLPQRLPR